jgi:hypothetical protein
VGAWRCNLRINLLLHVVVTKDWVGLHTFYLEMYGISFILEALNGFLELKREFKNSQDLGRETA